MALKYFSHIYTIISHIGPHWGILGTQGHLDPYRIASSGYVNFGHLVSFLGQKWPFLAPPGIPGCPRDLEHISKIPKKYFKN